MKTIARDEYIQNLKEEIYQLRHELQRAQKLLDISWAKMDRDWIKIILSVYESIESKASETQRR